MKMTWRWYGEGSNQIKLSDIKQIPGKDCGKLVTCEEHSIIGGLGEAVCAVIAEHGIPCR